MELNKIYCGDCVEILRGGDILDTSVDLLCIDPPYEFINKDTERKNVFGGIMKNTKEVNQNFGLSYNPSELLGIVGKKMKKFNAYIRTNKTLVPKYIQFAEEHGYKWELLLWLKSNPVPVFKGHYLIDKEYCVFIKEQGATFNSDLGYKNYFTYEIHPIGNRKYNHPTVKPIEFIERIIKVSSNEGDTVLDCYLGSGTTAVACKNLNRNYIGIEINPEYVELAESRLKEADTLKQQTLFDI